MALLLSNYIPRARGVTPEVESLVREFATRMPKSNQIDPDKITYQELVEFLQRVNGFVEGYYPVIEGRFTTQASLSYTGSGEGVATVFERAPSEGLGVIGYSTLVTTVYNKSDSVVAEITPAKPPLVGEGSVAYTTSILLAFTLSDSQQGDFL